MADEPRILRRRQDEIRAGLDAGRNGGRPGSPAAVGKVFDAGAMPASLPGQFSLKVQRVGGSEGEGSSVSTSDRASSIVATVVGGRVPAVGDLLIARLIEGRWVAEAKRPKTTPCACDVVPETMDVLSGYIPPYYGFYYDVGTSTWFASVPAKPTQFTYGARPAGLPATVDSYLTPSNSHVALTLPDFSWWSDKYVWAGHDVYDQLSFVGCVATIRQVVNLVGGFAVPGTTWSTTDATVSFAMTGSPNGSLRTMPGCSPAANTCEPFYIGNAVYSSYTGYPSARNSYNSGPILQRNGSTNIALGSTGSGG